MTRAVVVNDGQVNYVQNVSVGHHLFQADEPVDAGGVDGGPNPYELLLAALGACTGITVRMYAQRKRWPLESVQVRLTYVMDAIEEEVSVVGDLSEDQRRRLIEIAARCPVHRTLNSPVQIRTRPAPQGSDTLASR